MLAHRRICASRRLRPSTDRKRTDQSDLATRHSEERCQEIELDYIDPSWSTSPMAGQGERGQFCRSEGRRDALPCKDHRRCLRCSVGGACPCPASERPGRDKPLFYIYRAVGLPSLTVGLPPSRIINIIGRTSKSARQPRFTQMPARSTPQVRPSMQRPLRWRISALWH